MLNFGDSVSCTYEGVQTFLIPGPFNVLVISNRLALDGRCKTLDRSANGYVCAEACGVMEMQPVEDDPAQALVMLRGLTVNQDGRSSSFTAPNGPSQQAVIRKPVCVVYLHA
jgi:acyl transferase domain-containing protein